MQLNDSGYRLRPLLRADRHVLARLANDFEIWKHLRDQFPHPYTPADAEWFIDHVSDPENPARVFAISEEKELLGVIGLYPQKDVYQGTAEIGYWLGRGYWGKGITTAAVTRLVRFGFEELNLRRIYADVFSSNPASMRVLEKAGFSREGLKRAAILKNGQVLDAHLFAILHPAPPIG